MKSHRPYYVIGLMSGTSVDAVDAALVDCYGPTPRLIADHQHAIPEGLKARILGLCTPGDNEIARMGACDIETGRLFADAVMALLKKAVMQPTEITAIGSHGQTIRHCPNGPLPFTLQIGDPNQIAHLTGITTVADFRRRDMAAGGEGAPLAPFLHQAVFRTDHNRAIVNIGGIANLTLLPGDKTLAPTGFDTGPGNVLIDGWYQQQGKGPFDRDGKWAAGGQVIDSLLNQLLSHPYFLLPPPKSTGRELFNPYWLAEQIADSRSQHNPQDVCTTLVEYTARTIADALRRYFPGCAELFVCGGGAHNQYLLTRLQRQLPDTPISTTATLGIHPDWVEAVAFAWLAAHTLAQKPANIPSITGATQACILGAVYYGQNHQTSDT